MNDAIHRLLNPRSVALIGASADPTKTSGRPVSYLLRHGYRGRIMPVNPRVERIGELPCHADVASLPEVPDVGVVMLGAERAQEAVRALAARGAAAAIVLAGGYSETGADGARRQRELLDAAGSMRLLGPNTIGLVNLSDRIVLSASGALELKEFIAGGIGVVSQSGGILGALLSRATARGIGLSKLVATGNEADLDVSDFIDHLAHDEATRVIALYLEGIRDPDRFRRAALKAAAAGKPIVAFKIGRSESGARAAASHTGAMAGSDRVHDALFEQLGVLRARSFDDLLDQPAALVTGRRLQGRRIAILTSTGGAGTLVADEIGLAGFEAPPPDGPTGDALRALMPGDQAVLDRNPIDVTLAGLQPEILQAACEILLGSDGYDALALIVGSSGVGRPALMADAIRPVLEHTGKPVIAFVAPHAPEAAALLMRQGVPAYDAAERCASALRALRHAADVPGVEGAAPPPAPPADLDLPIGSLDESQAKHLFARFGVPCAREVVVSSAAEARDAAGALGSRVVLKLLSSTITHKSDVGGVAVGLDATSIAAAFETMASNVESRTGQRPQRFLVQEMVAGGTELILGLHRDPLGTAVLLGFGGVLAELHQDTAMRLLPPGRVLARTEALAMASSLKSWPLLNGYRGRPPADVDALAEVIVAFSHMACVLGDRLQEAEINPLFVLPRGQGVVAADGVAVLLA